jgi:hypothetical protein
MLSVQVFDATKENIWQNIWSVFLEEGKGEREAPQGK